MEDAEMWNLYWSTYAEFPYRNDCQFKLSVYLLQAPALVQSGGKKDKEMVSSQVMNLPLSLTFYQTSFENDLTPTPLFPPPSSTLQSIWDSSSVYDSDMKLSSSINMINMQHSRNYCDHILKSRQTCTL